MNIRMLGYNISNEMYKRKMSYRQLGERIHKQHATIGNHILDPRKITVEEMLKIAAALGIDWWDLMEGVDE